MYYLEIISAHFLRTNMNEVGYNYHLCLFKLTESPLCSGFLFWLRKLDDKILPFLSL